MRNRVFGHPRATIINHQTRKKFYIRKKNIFLGFSDKLLKIATICLRSEFCTKANFQCPINSQAPTVSTTSGPIGNKNYRVRISSAFSVLRPLYFDLSTSSALLRLADFELCTSNFVLRLLYFDLLSNLGFLLVENTGRSTVLVEVKRSK